MKRKYAVLLAALIAIAGASGLRANDAARVDRLVATPQATVPTNIPVWQPAVVIAQEKNHIYDEKVNIKFHPSGKLYVSGMDYDLDKQRYALNLWCWDGVRSTLVKHVSESTLQVYEPDMVIGEDGWIHLVWVEATGGNAEQWYFKYRYFDGNNWSPVIQLKTMGISGTTGGFNSEKIDDLRITVDKSHNLFIGYMIWPAGRCAFTSWYQGRVYNENFPQGGRSKHVCVASDGTNLHMIWQQLVGSAYTAWYARRPLAESSVGKWDKNLDVKGMDGRPRIAVSSDGYIIVVGMHDIPPDMTSRDLQHKFWTGNGFSGAFNLTPQMPAKWNNVSLAVGTSSNQIITAQIFQGAWSNSYYNWYRNGTWTDLLQFNTNRALGDFGEAAMSSKGIAAFAYVDMGPSIWLITSDKLIINEPPTAVITPSATEVFWGDSLNFSAAQSVDPDGSIALYEWDFNDGSTTPTVEGADKVNVTHAFDGVWGDVLVKMWTFDGSIYSPMASQAIKVKALYSCTATAAPKTIRTLLYNRQGTLVTWSANAKNTAAGFAVTKYLVMRTVGSAAPEQVYETSDMSLASYKFFDLTVPAGSTPVYSVISVDAAGHKSPPTNL